MATQITVRTAPDGSTVYTTTDGDVLDLIGWLYYGRQAGVVDPLLIANPHLLAYGPVLPGGLEIVLPEIAAPVVREIERVRLFDDAAS